MLDDHSAQRRFLGVAACSVRRVDPSDRLRVLFDDVPRVRARALRLAGELGRLDLLASIRHFLTDADEPTRFWAAWSSVLMGDRDEALAILRSKSGSDPLGFKAFQLSLLAMHHADAVAWLRDLGQTDPPLSIAGAGIVGDPALIPWLIVNMGEPRLGRLAGESFELITGAGIDGHGLARARSLRDADEEDFEDNIFAREYRRPWPDGSKVQDWWRQNRKSFSRGGKCLLGEPVTTDRLNAVLAGRASQRSRRIAALALALTSPSVPLINCAVRGRVRHSRDPT